MLLFSVNSINRIVGSKVANGIFFTNTLELVNLLNKVDFPALVYPIRATIGYGFFSLDLRCNNLVLTTFDN